MAAYAVTAHAQSLQRIDAAALRAAGIHPAESALRSAHNRSGQWNPGPRDPGPVYRATDDIVQILDHQHTTAYASPQCQLFNPFAIEFVGGAVSCCLGNFWDVPLVSGAVAPMLAQGILYGVPQRPCYRPQLQGVYIVFNKAHCDVMGGDPDIMNVVVFGQDPVAGNFPNLGSQDFLFNPASFPTAQSLIAGGENTANFCRPEYYIEFGLPINLTNAQGVPYDSILIMLEKPEDDTASVLYYAPTTQAPSCGTTQWYGLVNFNGQASLIYFGQVFGETGLGNPLIYPVIKYVDQSMTLTAAQTTIPCGQTTTLTASQFCSAIGPNPASIVWEPASAISGPNNLTTVTAAPEVNTTYTCTVTDGQGNTYSRTVTVNVTGGFALTSQPVVTINCGQSTTMIASFDCDPSATFQWRDANGVVANTASATVSPSLTTTYTITANNNPNLSATVTVNVNRANIPASYTIDCGASVQMSAEYLCPGVTPTYAWQEPSTSSTLGIQGSLPNPTVSPNRTTVYTVTLTGIPGGDITQEVTVNVSPQVVINGEQNVTAVCGGTAQLGISINCGTGQQFTRRWFANDVPQPDLTGNTVTVSPTGPTTYRVEVYNASNQLIGQQSFNVTVTNFSVTANAVPNVPVPYGAEVALSADIPGGVTGATYAWSPATGLSATDVQNPTARPCITTTYTVTATKGTCVPQSATVTVTVNEPLTADISAPGLSGDVLTVDAGTTVNFTATTNAGAGATYLWTDGTDELGTGPTLSLPFTSPGAVILSVTHNGCTAQDQITVQIGTNRADDRLASALQVYPNPTDGLLHLTYSGTPARIDVTALDLAGRAVLQRTMDFDSHDNAVLDLSSLAKGAYNLRFTDGQGVYTTKLILR
jgi:hypothetical protein